MRFWFKRKNLQPTTVETDEVSFNQFLLELRAGGYPIITRFGLPAYLVDDDFFEYILQESVGVDVPVEEFAELWDEWSAENCE